MFFIVETISPVIGHIIISFSHTKARRTQNINQFDYLLFLKFHLSLMLHQNLADIRAYNQSISDKSALAFYGHC